MKSQSIFCLLIAIACVLGGTLHAETERMGPQATVTFSARGTALSEAAKLKLDLLVKEARKNGQVIAVQIAAWSDLPTPREKQTLSDADQKLAAERVRVIQDYIDDPLQAPAQGEEKAQAPKAKIATYNMAERSSWLARAFDTTEADFKAEVSADPQAPVSKEQYRVFRENGKPSRGVVVVLLK